ncbi:MAG: hypothetical protein VB118_07880 [Oscillospiraceae bacterium]|nr:hypothetical protein [Oscillospiraceae bacterium]
MNKISFDLLHSNLTAQLFTNNIITAPKNCIIPAKLCPHRDCTFKCNDIGNEWYCPEHGWCSKKSIKLIGNYVPGDIDVR